MIIKIFDYKLIIYNFSIIITFNYYLKWKYMILKYFIWENKNIINSTINTTKEYKILLKSRKK